MTKTKASIVLALLAAAGIVGKYFFDRREGTATVLNVAPYTIWYALATPVASDRWETSGWWELQAGEKRTHSATFVRVTPSFLISARSAEGEVIRMIHAVPAEEEARIYWEGTEVFQVIPKGWSQGEVSGTGVSPTTTDAVGFFSASPVPDNPGKFVSIFSDSLCSPLAGVNRNSSLEGSEMARGLNEAKLLSESIDRQRAFKHAWGGRPQFPFHLGVALDDPNGFCGLGVHIVEAVSQTRDGYPMRLAAGDDIVQFDGRPVFGEADIWSLLHRHATDRKKGVDVPIPFVVRRNGQLVADHTNYFFDRDYFGVNSSDRIAAVWLGLSDSVFLGGGCAANAGLVKGLQSVANGLEWIASRLDEKHDPRYVEGPTFEDLRWGCNQRKAMVKQFESESFDMGSIGGMFFQPTRGIVKGLGGKSLARSTVGRVMIEVGETTIWTMVDGSPMRTPAELAAELRDAAPLAIGSGVIQGLLRQKRR